MKGQVLVIIPARGGSKGVENKNIRMFGGHPLIAYSITAAFFVRYASRVICSTDSYEIAEVAKRYGAEVPFLRPAEMAEDDSRDIEFCQHALKELDGDYDYVVILRPTSPIRPHGLINAGILKLVGCPDACSLRAVTESPATPFKMWEMRGVYLSPFTHDPTIKECYNAPRQELPRVYWQTGHLDVIRRRTIENGSISGNYILPHFVDRKYCIDIDTVADFESGYQAYCQFSATEIVMPCHPSPTCHPRHSLE
jgi:N-acylneuraminate cytidylyltransferase